MNFSSFNTSENDKSQTARAFWVPSVEKAFRNHVLPLVRFWVKKSLEKARVGTVSGFEGAIAKTGQTLRPCFFLQLCLFHNFTNSKTRYLKGVPLDLTQKARFVCELWIFLVLILSKMINHKRLELFEFRQLKNLLEIMFCHWCGFESRKVLKKQG